MEKNATTISGGAPYEIPISSRAILVLQTQRNKFGGSGSFSYRVVGEEYPFWETPFLGRTWLWYPFLVLIYVVPFAIFGGLIKAIQTCYKKIRKIN